MNQAILDTDIYSEVLKSVDPNVARNAAIYRGFHGAFTISAITLMEIVQGFERTQYTRRMRSFLATVAVDDILELDESAAELAGRIAGGLDRVGQPIGTAAPLIAATAIVHGFDLITGNTAHFQRVQQLGHALVLANWRQ